MQVFDGHVHAPFTSERHGFAGQERQVRLPRGRFREPAQVVVKELLRSCISTLGLVEHRLVLEQVLPPFHGPHLPVGKPFDQRSGERREVGGSGRGAGLDHQHVLRAPATDLDHTDLIEVEVATQVRAVHIERARRSRRRRRRHPHAAHHHLGGGRLGVGGRNRPRQAEHRRHHQPSEDRTESPHPHSSP